MHESSLILKQDILGRVRSTVDRRASVVTEFRRSGLTGYRFAQLSGIKYPTLMAWVKRAGGTTPVVSKARMRRKPVLVEAVVGGPAPTMKAVAPLLVHLGGGARMELTDAGQLSLAAQLIQALQRPC